MRNINYNQTACIDEIPEGYYCNNTALKTIDKCHDNCRTCEEGPKLNNNSCTACKETDLIYLNFGNCVDNCTYGFYEDNSIKKCKCNNKCKLCSYESQLLDLCISCNNEEGYYPKSNESINDGFVNCYKDPEGFF